VQQQQHHVEVLGCPLSREKERQTGLEETTNNKRKNRRMEDGSK
jgi:hypothetical protein